MVDRLSIAYPARSWPDFTDKLVQIAGLGDTHQELVARLLSSLAEEASSTELSSAMSSQRQSEIMQARPNSLRFFHPCSRHRCDSCFMQGLQTTALSFLTPFRDIIPRELAAFQSTRGMRHLNLCHACIELLGSYSPWLPAADLAAVNIIQIVVALLRMPELQVSMQCARRECSQSERNRVVVLCCVQADVVPIVSALACRKYSKVDWDFQYSLLEALPQACAEQLAAPNVALFSSFQSGLAGAVTDLLEHLLPWLQTQLTAHGTSTDRAVKVLALPSSAALLAVAPLSPCPVAVPVEPARCQHGRVPVPWSPDYLVCVQLVENHAALCRVCACGECRSVCANAMHFRHILCCLSLPLLCYRSIALCWSLSCLRS